MTNGKAAESGENWCLIIQKRDTRTRVRRARPGRPENTHVLLQKKVKKIPKKFTKTLAFFDKVVYTTKACVRR